MNIVDYSVTVCVFFFGACLWVRARFISLCKHNSNKGKTKTTKSEQGCPPTPRRPVFDVIDPLQNLIIIIHRPSLTPSNITTVIVTAIVATSVSFFNQKCLDLAIARHVTIFSTPRNARLWFPSYAAIRYASHVLPYQLLQLIRQTRMTHQLLTMQTVTHRVVQYARSRLLAL